MQSINKFEKDLKIIFKNKSLIKIALTHKSADQKNNNEKFEFLGDRVIGLVLSKKLFDLYPMENEGVLDKRFASLVNRKTCRDIAWSIGVQKYIITGNKKKNINIKDEKILSDCCEAIIGAIFLDKGYIFVKNFILKIWKVYLDESYVTHLDPKTKLQEHSLKKYKKLPFYQVISSSGPKHSPTYKISVTILNSRKFVGFGNSKQLAQQNAASKLLEFLGIS